VINKTKVPPIVALRGSPLFNSRTKVRGKMDCDPDITEIQLFRTMYGETVDSDPDKSEIHPFQLMQIHLQEISAPVISTFPKEMH